MAFLDLATLVVAKAKAEIYDFAIGIARDLELPVDTWAAGDPTRSLYHILAEKLEALEEIAVQFIRSGFLDWAEEDWLTLLAEQFFGVERIGATFATCTSTLTNAGGGQFTFAPGDLTVKNAATNKSYRNTTGGTLLAGVGQTLDLEFEAEEAGSGSTSGVGEIDTLVTVVLGVTISNTTAAVGLDEESDPDLRDRCRNKLGALSPNGPARAFAYVALTPTLTGTTEVTRVRVYPDADTGDVGVLIAGPSGAVSSEAETAVLDAIVEWSTPLCHTPSVDSASDVVIAPTYTLWLYESVNKTTMEVDTEVQAALLTGLRKRPIGGDIIPPATSGSLYQDWIEATISNVYPEHTFRVSVSSPGDTALDNDEVATLGAVTATINFIPDP